LHKSQNDLTTGSGPGVWANDACRHRLTRTVQFHIKPLHDRMPVILAPQDHARWLDPGDPERPPIDLLRPFPADAMTARKVSSAVGSTKNDRPELRLPMDAGPPGLFSGMNPEEALPLERVNRAAKDRADSLTCQLADFLSRSAHRGNSDSIFVIPATSVDAVPIFFVI
jgi:hypothetical protein